MTEGLYMTRNTRIVYNVQEGQGRLFLGGGGEVGGG